MPRPVWHPDSLADRLPFLRRRGELLRATRTFFADRGFTEVETPYAVTAPGEEVHLRAFATTHELPDGAARPLWLHTSPEFAMKRLLVAGSGPIFQFARVWRNGEASDLHVPEFTMLEWYSPMPREAGDTESGIARAAGATSKPEPGSGGVAVCAGIPTAARPSGGGEAGPAKPEPIPRPPGGPADRPGGAMDSLIAETTDLLRSVLPSVVTCRGVRTDLSRIERLTVAEAFSRYVGADLLATADDAQALAAAAGARLRDGETWEDLFFRLLLERVEPRIGRDHPTFLTHWPTAQAALARRDPADPRVAERFELFVCGIELANAFVELTDAAEQRARFVADRARRHALFGTDWPMDEDFLAALAHGMPDAAGIAMGFDRLAMIATGADRISQVLWLG